MAKAKRTPVYEEVMVRLAGLVHQGRLKPGDRLPPERALAERMHVSRATLREALRVMQLRGLIVSRQGAGNFIAGGKPEDLAEALHHLALQDIFELRLLIEPSIAALAAERANRQDLLRLDSILQQQEREMKEKRMTGLTDALSSMGFRYWPVADPCSLGEVPPALPPLAALGNDLPNNC